MPFDVLILAEELMCHFRPKLRCTIFYISSFWRQKPELYSLVRGDCHKLYFWPFASGYVRHFGSKLVQKQNIGFLGRAHPKSERLLLESSTSCLKNQ